MMSNNDGYFQDHQNLLKFYTNILMQREFVGMILMLEIA